MRPSELDTMPVIADNQIALGANWDDDVLRAEIEALSGDFDLDLLGFGDDELAAILNPPSASEADPDEEVEPPEVPVTVLGDVWLMGGHRILCGDSTSAEAVAAVLNGAKPHLMVTDPPYGVEYDATWRNGKVDSVTGAVKGRVGAGKNRGRASGKVANDDRADWREAWALFPGCVAYVWSAPGPLQIKSFESLVAADFDVRYQIIWNKAHLVIGRGNYHWKHEPCWYGVRAPQPSHWQGSRTETSVWDIDHRKSETGHSTQKPVECMKRPIENNSKPGDAVYEPFSGSGTTIIAAEMTGRHCLAIELSPAYVDVAVLRWETFTGRVATLEATGQTFREVSDERRLAAKAA